MLEHSHPAWPAPPGARKARTVRALAAALVAGIVCAIHAPPLAAQTRAVRPPCGGDVLREVLVAVDDRGELRFASGRIAVLSDLRLPEGEFALRAVARLREEVGAELGLSLHYGEDRWGRLRVAAVTARGAGLVDLARILLEDGLALADPGEPDGLCRPELLQVEEEARRKGLGLWGRDGYKPMQADDEGELRQRIGQFVLVEGRIRSVGERRSRTYLNFSRQWERDFTVTIPRRTWTRMSGLGWTAESLRGRRVRVRGVLETWRGPALEITSTDSVEILDRER